MTRYQATATGTTFLTADEAIAWALGHLSLTRREAKVRRYGNGEIGISGRKPRDTWVWLRPVA